MTDPHRIQPTAPASRHTRPPVAKRQVRPLLEASLFDGLEALDPPMRGITLASGSSGNATLVQAGRQAVLIDCGVAWRRVEAGLRTLGLRPWQLAGVLITHSHGDHCGGLAALLRQRTVPVVATAPTLRALARAGHLGEAARDMPVELLQALRRDNEASSSGEGGGHAAQVASATVNTPRSLTLPPGARTNGVPPLLPVRAQQWVRVGPFDLYVVPTSHDQAGSVAMLLAAGGRRLVVLTDLGETDELHGQLVASADVALVEANHCVEMLHAGRYSAWAKRRIASREGHLSNQQAADLLRGYATRRLRQVICVHLSTENNHPDRARATLAQALAEAEATRQCVVTVAPRHTPSAVFNV